MGNNLFYKALAGLSTVGVLVIAASLVVPIVSPKGNDLEESIAKTQQELKKARNDALGEVKAFRKDALDDVSTARKEALSEVKAARAASLKAIQKAQGTNKERIWLVVRVGGYNSGGWSDMPVALEKIEMESLEQCELQGALWVASKNIANRDYLTGFECLEGK